MLHRFARIATLGLLSAFGLMGLYLYQFHYALDRKLAAAQAKNAELRVIIDRLAPSGGWPTSSSPSRARAPERRGRHCCLSNTGGMARRCRAGDLPLKGRPPMWMPWSSSSMASSCRRTMRCGAAWRCSRASTGSISPRSRPAGSTCRATSRWFIAARARVTRFERELWGNFWKLADDPEYRPAWDARRAGRRRVVPLPTSAFVYAYARIQRRVEHHLRAPEGDLSGDAQAHAGGIVNFARTSCFCHRPATMLSFPHRAIRRGKSVSGGVSRRLPALNSRRESKSPS